MVERKGDGIASFTGKMMHSGTEILSVEPQRGAEESKFSGMYGQSPPSLILYSLREIRISDRASANATLFDGGERKIDVGSIRFDFPGALRVDVLLHLAQGTAIPRKTGFPLPSGSVWNRFRLVGAAVSRGGDDGAPSAPLRRLLDGHVGRVFHDHGRVRLFDPSPDRCRPAAEPVAGVYSEAGEGAPENPPSPWESPW